MNGFSRLSIIEILSLLEGFEHADITRLLLKYGLETVAPETGRSPKRRVNALIKHIIDNPGLQGPMGSSLIVELAVELAQKLIPHPSLYDDVGLVRTFDEMYPRLCNALRKDGYVFEGTNLRRTLPETLDLPEQEDELHNLLDQFGFLVSKGHLDQAINGHTRSEWAAANAQLRTFVESLMDDIVVRIAPERASQVANGHARRELLAQREPPFFLPDLNEWKVGDRGGFLQGFLRRLHPEGSHPGLSDEEDCTFRLHLVLLVGLNMLRRLARRVGPGRP